MIERREDKLRHNNNSIVTVRTIITIIVIVILTIISHKKYKLPSTSIIAAASFEHSGIAQGSISVPNQCKITAVVSSY